MEHKVIIYSTPTCPYCRMVKQFLQEKSVKFEDKNVAEDEKAADEMIQRSGQMGVPVVDVDGQLVIGFDREKLIELLK